MAADPNDYFQRLGGSSSLVNSPKVTSTRSPAGTTLAVDNCNWDTTTGKIFATYQIDTSSNVVPGTQIIWKGVVTSTTSIGSMTRLAGATDVGNIIGDIVELLPASAWGNNIATGLLVGHTQTGLHTLSSSDTLTSSKIITSLNDTNGNELFKVTATVSAVNEVTVANAATGGNPILSATGGDTNINLELRGKGTGGVIYKNPYKFSAYASGTTSLGAGVYTKIAFATEEYDTGSNYDNATNYRFVAPVAGFYSFFAGFQATAGAANELYVIALYKNGTIFKKGNGTPSAASGTMNVTVSPPPFQLSANDYVEVFGFQNSGGSKTVSSGQADTYFGGYLIST